MISNEVYALLDYFEKSSIREMDLKIADFHIKLSKENAAGGTVLSQPSDSKSDLSAEALPAQPSSPVLGIEVKSSLVGVFHVAASPETPPLAPVGTKVKKGQALGLIESMKMFTEILAPVDGIVEKVFAANADLVEFDQPLFEIKEA